MGLSAVLSTQVIDTTSVGRSVMTAADAAAVRTAISSLGGSVGATDNRLVRSDGTGTLTVQSTGITVDDSNNVSGVGTLAVGGTLTATTASAGTIAFSSLLVMTGSSQRVILRHISVPSVSYHAWGIGQYVTTSSNVIGFSPSSDPNTDPDIAIGRDSAGVLGIYTSNAKTTKGGLTCGAITSDALVCAGAYTVATLPSASANAGKFAQVTDSSVTTFGSTVSGGGSNRVPVFSNGTNWVVA